MKLSKLFIFSLLTLSSVACRDKSLEELRGRYQGLLTLRGQVWQVVAEVPAAKEKGEFKTLQLALYQTLGTAKPERVFIQIADSFVTLQSPLLGNKEYKLTLNPEKCGVGEEAREKIKLCATPGKVSLELTDKELNQVVVSLLVTRDDTLPPPPKSEERNGHYSLDELVGRARFTNYAVSQDAEKVFQAKQRIKIAIGNLLPHFNMKDLLAFVTGGPLGGVEAIGSFLPFLFPSNWYKLDEAKELAKAKTKSFASLRGNEMQYVESAVYLVARDLAIEDFMGKNLVRQKEIHRTIERKELLGLLPPKSAEKYYLNMLLAEQDRVQLRNLIVLEHSALSHAVALPAASGIAGFLPMNLPDMNTVRILDAKNIIKDAQTRSFEVATLNYLVEASRQNTKAHAWGFLDPNSSDVIGFGYAAMLRVGKASERELINKREETLSLIDQKTVVAVAEYNNSLKSYQIAQVGLNMADERLKRLVRRLQIGDDRVNDEYFVQEMSEASTLLLKSNANYITSVYALLMAKSKIERLMLSGFYQDLELTVE